MLKLITKERNAVGGTCASGWLKWLQRHRQYPNATDGANLQTLLRFPETSACSGLRTDTVGPDFYSFYKCHLRPFYPVYDLVGKQTRNNTFL